MLYLVNVVSFLVIVKIEKLLVGKVLAGHPLILGHPVMVELELVVVQVEGMTVVMMMRVTLTEGPTIQVVGGDSVVGTQADHLEAPGDHLVEMVVDEDPHLLQVMILVLLQVMIQILMVGMIVVVLEMVAMVRLDLLHCHRLPQVGEVVGQVGEEE